MLALHLNCFVAVVQSFEKIEPLRALAQTQSEPPFAIAHLAVLALGIFAAKGFRDRTGLKRRPRAAGFDTVNIE